MIKALLDNDAQGEPLEILNNSHIPTTVIHNSIPIGIELGKTLNINVDVDKDHWHKLIQVLHKYRQDFSWDYSYMKDIDPQLCTHHIYIEKYACLI